MKYHIYIILFLLISINGFTQVDRTKRPGPGPAPEIKIGKYKEFELANGLKVFVVENHKLPKVSFSLVLDRDPILEGNKSGYVSIAGELIGRGTKTRTKEQLDEEIDFIGATLSSSSSGMYASSLKKHSEKLVELMSDIILNPAFSQSELDKIKKQTLSSLAMGKDNPDAISDNVTSVLLYGKNHPYGEVTTEETVNNIKLDDCKDFFSKYYRPNIGYLAIVGDITKKEAERLVKRYFSNWEKADVPMHKYEKPKALEKTEVAIVNRPAAVQSVINVTYPVELFPGQPEVIKARMMNEMLGGSFTSRLNLNLREKHGYTYGIHSSLSPDKLISKFGASAKVRNNVTDSAIYEILKELRLITEEKVTEKELQKSKNYGTGSFARSLENPQTVASFAINTARYNLPGDYYTNYLKNLNKVTIDEIYEMAKRYIRPNNAHIVIVGKAEEIAKKLSAFGTIKYYDIYGNAMDTSAKVIPNDITPREIYKNYIKALGGEENIRKIKDVESKGTMIVQGITFHVLKANKLPNKVFMVAKMGETESFKLVINDNRGVESQMGQRREISGRELEDVKLEEALFYELDAEKMQTTLKLLELTKVDGVDTYKIELTFPGGKKILQYFNKENSLKVKEEKVETSPEGESIQTTKFANYKAVNGVLFPHQISNINESFTADFIIISTEVNKGIKDELFVIK